MSKTLLVSSITGGLCAPIQVVCALSSGTCVAYIYWRSGLLTDVEIEVSPLDPGIGVKVEPLNTDVQVKSEPICSDDRISTAHDGTVT